MDAFRKLNVDQYDEDRLTRAELIVHDSRSPPELLQVAQTKQGAVRSKMASGDVAGALATVLTDPPYGTHAEEAKDITFALLLEILNSTRSTDIPNAIKSLNLDQRDTLTKYLYKGFALGSRPATAAHSVNCAVLLGWHQKLTQP
ncbi:hypothetical protein MVES_000834 [Malassezia vespertilionis]|uniref:Actin-related protein 2/3 complex subunit 5 n=1 Tax=Malassezia vespertilionis TaxID=2020962 RepID=A0A2N1JER6_9BASI|nr:hypothetical protein MVES_000834 [Malassezia vespertilionis]